MKPSELKPITITSALLAIFCAALWGGTGVAVQYTQEVLPPIGTAGFRFLLSCFFLVAWCYWEGTSLKIRVNQIVPIVVIGIMLYLQIGLYHWGLTKTNSSHGSVLLGAHPVMVSLLAHYFLKGDRLNPQKSLGFLLCLIGLIAVISGAASEAKEVSLHDLDPVGIFGDIIILISSAILAIKVVYSKVALRSVEAGKLVLWSNLFGTALFFITSGLTEGFATYSWNWQAVVGLLYQGVIVAGFCFIMWNILLGKHPASQLSVFAFVQPLFGVALGSLFRGDQLTLWLIGGSAAVAAGVYLVTSQKE